MDKCPKCGAEIWDNSEKNIERIAQGLKPMPQFKCKAECGWVKWPLATGKQVVLDELASDQRHINNEPEPTKAPEKAEVDWDGKEHRMVRMNVLNRATDLIIAGHIKPEDLDKTVDKLEAIIYKKSARTNDLESSND